MLGRGVLRSMEAVTGAHDVGQATECIAAGVGLAEGWTGNLGQRGRPAASRILCDQSACAVH